jgi:hypothetical protein
MLRVIGCGARAMYQELHEITEADRFTKNYGAKQLLLTVVSDVENG